MMATYYQNEPRERPERTAPRDPWQTYIDSLIRQRDESKEFSQEKRRFLAEEGQKVARSVRDMANAPAAAIEGWQAGKDRAVDRGLRQSQKTLADEQLKTAQRQNRIGEEYDRRAAEAAAKAAEGQNVELELRNKKLTAQNEIDLMTIANQRQMFEPGSFAKKLGPELIEKLNKAGIVVDPNWSEEEGIKRMIPYQQYIGELNQIAVENEQKKQQFDMTMKQLALNIETARQAMNLASKAENRAEYSFNQEKEQNEINKAAITVAQLPPEMQERALSQMGNLAPRIKAQIGSNSLASSIQKALAMPVLNPTGAAMRTAATEQLMAAKAKLTALKDIASDVATYKSESGLLPDDAIASAAKDRIVSALRAVGMTKDAQNVEEGFTIGNRTTRIKSMEAAVTNLKEGVRRELSNYSTMAQDDVTKNAINATINEIDASLLKLDIRGDDPASLRSKKGMGIQPNSDNPGVRNTNFVPFGNRG